MGADSNEWVGGDLGTDSRASFEHLPLDGDDASGDPAARPQAKRRASSRAGATTPGRGHKRRQQSFCGPATLAEASLVTQAFDAVAVGGDAATPGYLDYREGTAKAFKVLGLVATDEDIEFALDTVKKNLTVQEPATPNLAVYSIYRAHNRTPCRVNPFDFMPLPQIRISH
jgi:hypothetical protein